MRPYQSVTRPLKLSTPAGKLSAKMQKLPLKRIVITVAGVAIILVFIIWQFVGNSGEVLYLGAATAKAAENPDIEQAIDDADLPETSDDPASVPAPDSELVVYISGAVKAPGVVRLPTSARLEDAVSGCGGLSGDAALDYINLAAHLSDGSHIHIPTQAEIDELKSAGKLDDGQLFTDNTAAVILPTDDQTTTANSAAGSPDNNKTSALIDINKADSVSLQTVPGIGPVTAQRIIDYRTKNGRFKQLADLKNVTGIGEKRFADMQPYLTCS